MKKYLFLLIAVVAFESDLWAQPDSIIAENIYKYKVLNGKRTAEKQIIEQKTYDLKGKLIRQIAFKDTLMKIDNYVAFIYDNKNLVSAETFQDNDSILEIKRYSYLENDLLSNIDIYKRIEDKIKFAERIEYNYNDTMLIEKVTSNQKNKWQKKTNYTYNVNEIIEYTQYKKGYKDDKLKSKEIISQIKDGNILSSEIKKTYYTKEIREIQVIYEYDPVTSKVLREVWTSANDSVPKIIEYRYMPDGTKTAECVVNEDGKYIEFIGFERKKHDVIRTEVKMYDLGKETKK